MPPNKNPQAQIQSAQIPMDFAPNPEFCFENFAVGPSNEKALALIQGWQAWPAPALLLQGPKGSGKTHLGTAWSRVVGSGNFIDDADRREPQDVFAHSNDALSGDSGPLLLSSTLAPEGWPHTLPDLHSRMKNMAVATLHDPDDEVLEAVIRKLFEDTGRSVGRDVVKYLITYSPRSVPALRLCVGQLDMAARSAKADITKSFASRFLTAQLKSKLYFDLEASLLQTTRSYREKTGTNASFIIPIHSIYGNINVVTQPIRFRAV